MRRIGVLMAYAEDDLEAQAWIRALLQGLKEHGWIDGSTASFDYRWAGGNLKPMGSYAAELMALNPDLIVAAATPALEAVWRETRSVPIVFVNVADPIGQGFVAGMAHPGGNVTGFTSFEFSMGANGSKCSKRFHHRWCESSSPTTRQRHRISRYSSDG
jgi:ABC-type uncharacterized transport system substrate-binding protein